MKRFAVFLSLLLLALVPIKGGAQQPVILPEPVPIEEPLEEPQPQDTLQTPETQEEAQQSFLSIWEDACNAMQSESLRNWLPICLSAVRGSIPYIPGMIDRILRIIPRTVVLLIQLIRALPSIFNRAWSFIVSLPEYIRSIVNLIQQLLDVLSTCIRIIPQIMGSAQQPQQSSLTDLLSIMGTLMG